MAVGQSPHRFGDASGRAEISPSADRHGSMPIAVPRFLRCTSETTPSRAIVQSAGHAFRLPGQRLKEEFRRNGELHQLLLRYTQALITQMSQTAVCNRHHSVDQQLCRWLLLSLDRLPSNRLIMTQELIANMLGVRREGVTEAAGKLQKLGVIRYARGQITVMERETLEQLCCECYAVVKRETDRVLPPAQPKPAQSLRD